MTEYSSMFGDLEDASEFDTSHTASKLEQFPLSPDQALVVNQPANSNIIVNAGAGSGKTRVIIARAVKLIEMGADPQSIALVTFTKESALEMTHRLKELNVEVGYVGTVHALCFKYFDPGFDQEIIGQLKIAQEDDQLAIAKNILLPDINLRKLFKEPQELLGYVEKRRQELRQAEVRGDPICRLYISRMLERFNADFTHLLELASQKRSKGQSLKLFQYILGDEAQDLTYLQEDCLGYFAKPDARFFFVGDLRQSIFTFRGRSHFSNSFSFNLLKDKVVAKFDLVENRRNSPEIVELANALVQLQVTPQQAIREAQAKYPIEQHTFAEFPEELKFVLARREALPKDQTLAVLLRTNRAVEYFIESMARASVPYPESGIVVQTMHESKGREYDVVVCSTMEAGTFPHQSSETAFTEDSERRLLYVATTRAKNELHFVTTMSRYPALAMNKKFALPSSFMPEIESVVRRAQREKAFGSEDQALPRRKQAAAQG